MQTVELSFSSNWQLPRLLIADETRIPFDTNAVMRLLHQIVIYSLLNSHVTVSLLYLQCKYSRQLNVYTVGSISYCYPQSIRLIHSNCKHCHWGYSPTETSLLEVLSDASLLCWSLWMSVFCGRRIGTTSHDGSH